MLFAIVLQQNFEESRVGYLVGFDHFFGIELDVPKRRVQTNEPVELLLWFVDDPYVQLGRIVDDLLDFENDVADTLFAHKLLVHFALGHFLYAVHLLFELWQPSWNLLDDTVVG